MIRGLALLAGVDSPAVSLSRRDRALTPAVRASRR